ncbi:SDR family NAD(P)-dependent oxidoreductase, partial [Lacticaseibacillus rhamnosus]
MGAGIFIVCAASKTTGSQESGRTRRNNEDNLPQEIDAWLHIGEKDEITGAGGKAVAIPTNLVKPEEVERLVETVRNEYGRLDVLVNNAFRMDPFESFETVDLAKWR